LRLSFISLISRSTSSMNLKGIRHCHFEAIYRFDILDDEIYDLVFQHRLGVSVGDEERYIISLWSINLCTNQTRFKVECTLMGFLRRTMKLSARCIRNRVNLWQRMRSISSACLILMLTRIELTEGSISTRSFSFRDIVNGFRRTSLDPLRAIRQRGVAQVMHSRDFHFRLVVTLDDLRRRL
jgi:hypothetical protein